MKAAASRHHRGYVLLLTLVLLAMVATGLAGIARRSHAAALEANRLERDAQRRWLATSARQLLPEADQLLIAWNEASATSSASARAEFDLGHHRVSLTLGDEQAKANLNTLWTRYDPAVVRAKATALAASSRNGSGSTPHLRPIGAFEAKAAGTSLDWPAFVSLEQVLTADGLHRLLQTPSPETSLLDYVTLWGGGRLRIDRASRPALEAVLTPLLSPGQVDRFLAERFENPPLGSRVTDVSGLRLTDRQREQLTGYITAKSSCFSVRLRLDDQRRIYTHLAVRQKAVGSSEASTLRFDW
ncbi:MAG: hypothetical protein AAGG38_10225 [Planctomycetota bacterium]